MKAYQLGEPFGLEALRLLDLPEPEPGPGEVKLRVRAVSLNYRDLLIAKGDYSRRLPLPLVPGSDGAGEVASVGEGVRHFAPGDRVVAAFFQRWLEGPIGPAARASALGAGRAGMLAEYVVLREEGLLEVPAHLSFEEAACLPCAGVTAWHALEAARPLAEGESVLTQGSGGVSLFALQFAKLRGARVIATSSRDERCQRLKSLGADETINYRDQPEWDRRVLELTGGQGVDRVVEVGGAGTLAALAPRRARGRPHRRHRRARGQGLLRPHAAHHEERAPPRHQRRAQGDVRGDEPHHRGERLAPDHRPRLPHGRAPRGLAPHGGGGAFREDLRGRVRELSPGRT